MPRLGNAQLDRLATLAGKKYGLPPSLIRAVIQQESGGDPNIGSGAGAQGLMQLMPGTARGLGVTDVHNPLQNVMGGAKYLKSQLQQFGSIPLALAAYNAGPGAVSKYSGVPPYAETQNYVKNVQALEDQYSNLGGGGGSDIQPPTMPAVGQPVSAPGAPGAQSPIANPLQGAIDALQHPSMLASQLQKIGGASARIGKSLESPLMLPTRITNPQPAPGPQNPDSLEPGTENWTMPDGTDQAPKGWQKWVILGSGADRSGATTQTPVLEFAAKIGKMYGSPLTIGTGTNHNQYVQGTHRESQHWTGHAADIPSEGDALTRMGQTALIAAGMPHDQALKQKGGVFNVGKYQILFNTMTGGNHFNHLHIGVR